MRIISLLTILGFQALPCHASDVEVRISKPHALYVFAETVAGFPHRSKALKLAVPPSEFNRPAFQKLLFDFQKVAASLNDTAPQATPLPHSTHPPSYSEVILIETMLAEDLLDLDRRLQKFLPDLQRKALNTVLTQLLPFYDRLIWNPSLHKLQHKKKLYEDVLNRKDVKAFLEQPRVFLQSTWPVTKNFIISLYPIPGKSGQSSAESLGGFESVGVLADETDHYGRLGVIIHELTHTLYHTQNPQMKEKMKLWFNQKNSAYGRLAYLFFNEAFATATGNGYFVEIASGKNEDKSWYNNLYIENYARAIYPLIKSYLRSAKVIDKKFVDEVVSVFKNAMPNAPLEFDALLTNIVMLYNSNSFIREDLRLAFDSKFRISSRSTWASLSDQEGVAAIYSNIATNLIIFKGSETEEIKPILARLGISEPIKDIIFKEPAPKLFVIPTYNDNLLFLFKVESTSELNKLLIDMYQAKKVDTSKIVQF